jgi:membrane-associated phospholipid phosphatase
METDINFALQQLGPAFAAFMHALSFLGTEDLWLLLVPFIFWCVDSGFGARLLFLVVISDFVNGLLKWLFHLPRPYWVDSRVTPLESEVSYGLPSGHTQSATVGWGYLAVRINRWWMWLISALVIVGVATARVALGMHFVGDVIGGLIAGLIVLTAFVLLEPRVTRWIAPRPIGFQIATAFLASLAMIVVVLIARSTLGGVADPIGWAQLSAQAGVPNAPRGLDTPITDAAIVFGAGAGLALLKQSGGFNARGPWSKRIARLVLGLLVLIVLRFGLGAIFPREPELLGAVFRYVRYVIMVLWATWLAPWVFVKLRLA